MARLIVKAKDSLKEARRTAERRADESGSPVEIHVQAADDWLLHSTVQPRTKRSFWDRLFRRHASQKRDGGQHE